MAISACVGGLWADMCFAHVMRRCTYVQIYNYLNVILDFSFVPTSLYTSSLPTLTFLGPRINFLFVLHNLRMNTRAGDD